MEARTRWTDDRLDSLAGEVKALRVETREGFRELRMDFRWLFGLQVTTLLSVAAIAIEVLAH